MKRFGSFLLAGLVAGLLLTPSKVVTQAPALLFGSSSGATQVIKATSNALWVSIQSGAAPVFTAGGGTDTFKSSGVLFTGRKTTDSAVQNDWNFVSQAISANTFNTNGQVLKFLVGLVGANNANTHEYQAYFADNSSTCGGTGAALCTTGTIVLPSVTNTTANAGEYLEVIVIRTGSGTQDYIRHLDGGPNISVTTGTATQTDSGIMKFVFGTRNTTAAAASLSLITYLVEFSEK